MKALLLALVWLLLSGAAPGIVTGPLLLCPGSNAGHGCRTVDLTTVDLAAPETLLARVVTVDAAALPLARPQQVRVIALASSELRWNDVLIGRNGVPAPTRAGETPGLFVASFVVPAELVRPGRNLLTVRLSANHLFLPVRTPVHAIEVGPYETPSLPGLAAYLPALLALGALAAAFAYFAFAALDRRDRDARLLAAIALAVIAQLLIEVSRAFVPYLYPWHLARVSAVALLAALTAALAAAYAARRFVPGSMRTMVVGVGLAAGASLLILPWYDLKALSAIFVGALALGLAGIEGVRHRRRGARAALAGALAIVVLMAWQRTAFLDQAYFLIAAALLVALVAEQVASLRRARAERDAETRRAAALAERLARAERAGEPILALKDGTRTHRVAEGDVVAIRAADDYCEVRLSDGRELLVTTNLSALLATLPERFLRVHKSHAVNRAHVVGARPRPGGGRRLALSEGSEIPVGRAYAAAVAAWLEPTERR